MGDQPQTAPPLGNPAPTPASNLFAKINIKNPLQEFEQAKKEAVSALMNPRFAGLFPGGMTEEKARKIVNAASPAVVSSVLKPSATGDERTAYESLVEDIRQKLEAKEEEIGLKDAHLRLALAENTALIVIQKKKNPGFIVPGNMMRGTTALVGRLLNEKLAEMDKDTLDSILDFAGEISGSDEDRITPREALRAKFVESIAESIVPLVVDSRFRKQSGEVQRRQFRHAITEGLNGKGVIANNRAVALASDVVAFNVAQLMNEGEALPPVERGLYMDVMKDFVAQQVKEQVQKKKADSFLLKTIVDFDALTQPFTAALVGAMNRPYFHTLNDPEKKKHYLTSAVAATIKQSGSNVLLADMIASIAIKKVVPHLSKLPPEMKADPAQQADAIYHQLKTPIEERGHLIAELRTLAGLKDDNERAHYLEVKNRNYRMWEQYEKGVRPPLQREFHIIESVAMIPDLAKKYRVDLRPFGMADGASAKDTSELTSAIKRLKPKEIYEPRANSDARTTNLIQPTGLTGLTGQTEDLKAAAKHLDALGIRFEVKGKSIIVDSAVVDSFLTNIPPVGAKMTSAALIAKQDEEAERLAKEKRAREQQEKADEIAYLNNLESRSRILGDYLRQRRNPGGGGMAQAQPLSPDLFNLGDIMFMQRCPEKLGEEFKKTYALLQVMWERQEQEQNPNSPLFNPQLAGAPAVPLPIHAAPLFSQLPNHANVNHAMIMNQYGSKARFALASPGNGSDSLSAHYAMDGPSAPVGSGGMPNQRPGYTPPGSVPRGNGSSVGPSQ